MRLRKATRMGFWRYATYEAEARNHRRELLVWDMKRDAKFPKTGTVEEMYQHVRARRKEPFYAWELVLLWNEWAKTTDRYWEVRAVEVAGGGGIVRIRLRDLYGVNRPEKEVPGEVSTVLLVGKHRKEIHVSHTIFEIFRAFLMD